MKYLKNTVKFLTLLVSFSFTSCAFIHGRYGESCKTHAYLNREIQQFIRSRFNYNSPVRMAIIPFSVSANLSAKNAEQPGLGDQIAWLIHASLLKSGEIPIIEVFNRQDWPGKKEEFFTGNFGAIDMARQAGYDLVMIGYVEPQNGLSSVDSYVKILDAESGVTVYYGKITSGTIRPDLDEIEDIMLLGDKVPSKIYLQEITEKLAGCISEAVLSEAELE